MRSSKSRSRSKTSRPRTLGNIINRVFDSSGPEGKVRGTPAQLIEKYQFLARDAQLSNDRVAAENFLQHAEHYTRLLAEANREMAAEQESRQQFQQSGNQNGGQNGSQQNGQNGQNQQRDRPQGERDQRNDQRNDQRGDQRNDQRGDQRNDRRDERSDYRPEFRDVAADDQPIITAHDLVDHVRYDDAGLVETPEAAPRPVRAEEPRRTDRPRYERPRDEQRRSYPPRVDQHQAERQEKPSEVRTAEPVGVASQSAPKPKPAPKPPVQQAEVKQPVADAPSAPKPRTRAPRKPAEGAAKPDQPVAKATEE